MNWYKIKLTDKQIRFGEIFRLQADFGMIFAALRFPKGCALFSDSDFIPDKNSFYLCIPDADKTVYTSLFAKYSAKPCKVPKRKRIALLLGRSDSWNLLK